MEANEFKREPASQRTGGASGSQSLRRAFESGSRQTSVRRRLVIFVDTGAWFAALVPNDPDHAAAELYIIFAAAS